LATDTINKIMLNNENMAQVAQALSDSQFDIPAMTGLLRRLIEKYERLEKHHERLHQENRLLQTQLSELSRSLDLSSRIDPMTRLANRRDIMEKIQREHSRTTRHHRPFSILMIDLDRFQQINDVFGFNAGDDVIVEVARVLMSCIRSEDICARWSGEEFLVLLPETELSGALTVAQKIRESIDMTEFRTQKQGIHITASLGICEHIAGQSVIDCINRVIQGLKTAKMAGGNQVCQPPA